MIFTHRCALVLTVSLLLGGWSGAAQDVRLAQPYASGLLLNPALAGITAVRTVSIATRNQNPEAGNNFLTGTICADARIPRLRGSLGFALSFDRAGDAPLNRTQAQAVYAYQTRLTGRWAASGAVSGGIGFQNGNLSRYVFGDQLQADGSTTTTTETLPYSPVFYSTVGAGLVVYEKHGWIGLALHHANAPQLGDWASATRIAPRMVVHGGYKFFLLSASTLNRFYEFSVTPVATMQVQGPARGYDIGFSACYSPVILGILYRNPLLISAQRDQRWLVGQIGLRRPGFSIGYSYELGISTQTVGFAAHELTLRLDQADYSGLRSRRNTPKQAPFIASPPF